VASHHNIYVYRPCKSTNRKDNNANKLKLLKEIVERHASNRLPSSKWLDPWYETIYIGPFQRLKWTCRMHTLPKPQLKEMKTK